jgi:hypothetical protein
MSEKAQDSTVNTVSLPNVGEDPATLGSAVMRPFRVSVNNTGPVAVLVAYDVGALQTQPAIAGTYEIQAGKDQVFVLQPGQKLLGVGLGAGGRVSVACSMAIPETFGA